MCALMSRAIGTLAAVWFVVSFASGAVAAIIPAYEVSPSYVGSVDTDPNAYSRLGFEFTTATPLTIQQLGHNAHDEFAGVRQVNITAVGGAALSPALTALVTVPNGGTADDQFVYTSLSSPYTLAAGTYWIWSPVPTGMGYFFSNNPADDIEAPGIVYVNGVVDNTTTVARFYNVNFQFGELEVVPAPEPSSLLLASLGIVGWSVAARRRRRSAH